MAGRGKAFAGSDGKLKAQSSKLKKKLKGQKPQKCHLRKASAGATAI
jgi:hypothetical protein